MCIGVGHDSICGGEQTPPIVCLCVDYVLVTSKVISERVLTCESAHSWRLYSAASLIHQATGTITCYPIILTLSPILIMKSARLGSDNYQFKSNWFDSTRV